MRRILIGVGVLSLLSAPAVAADGFSAKVDGWKTEPWGGTAYVRIENATRQPNFTWLRIDCIAKRGLREIVGQDFGFYQGTIQPGKNVSVGVTMELHGERADRAECEVYLTDKTGQSEYERRLR